MDLILMEIYLIGMYLTYVQWNKCLQILSSLERMEKTSMALECRGFGNTNNPTNMSDIVIRKRDIALVAVSVLLLVASIVLRIRYGSLNVTDYLNSWSDCFRLGIR